MNLTLTATKPSPVKWDLGDGGEIPGDVQPRDRSLLYIHARGNNGMYVNRAAVPALIQALQLLTRDLDDAEAAANERVEALRKTLSDEFEIKLVWA